MRRERDLVLNAVRSRSAKTSRHWQNVTANNLLVVLAVYGAFGAENQSQPSSADVVVDSLLFGLPSAYPTVVILILIFLG